MQPMYSHNIKINTNAGIVSKYSHSRRSSNKLHKIQWACSYILGLSFSNNSTGIAIGLFLACNIGLRAGMVHMGNSASTLLDTIHTVLALLIFFFFSIIYFLIMCGFTSSILFIYFFFLFSFFFNIQSYLYFIYQHLLHTHIQLQT